MQIILILGTVATAWVFLSVLSGESQRLRQNLDAKQPPAAAGAVKSQAGHGAKSK